MKKTIIFFIAFAICVFLFLYSKENFSKSIFLIIGLFYLINSLMYFAIFFYKKHVKKRIFLFIIYAEKENQSNRYGFFSKPTTPKDLSTKDFNDWIISNIKENHKCNYSTEIEPVIINVSNISSEYYFV